MYDHRLKFKKYATSLPPMGCEVVERHLEVAQPTKKYSQTYYRRKISIHRQIYTNNMMKMPKSLGAGAHMSP